MDNYAQSSTPALGSGKTSGLEHIGASGISVGESQTPNGVISKLFDNRQYTGKTSLTYNGSKDKVDALVQAVIGDEQTVIGEVSLTDIANGATIYAIVPFTIPSGRNTNNAGTVEKVSFKVAWLKDKEGNILNESTTDDNIVEGTFRAYPTFVAPATPTGPLQGAVLDEAVTGYSGNIETYFKYLVWLGTERNVDQLRNMTDAEGKPLLTIIVQDNDQVPAFEGGGNKVIYNRLSSNARLEVVLPGLLKEEFTTEMIYVSPDDSFGSNDFNDGIGYAGVAYEIKLAEESSILQYDRRIKDTPERRSSISTTVDNLETTNPALAAIRVVYAKSLHPEFRGSAANLKKGLDYLLYSIDRTKLGHEGFSAIKEEVKTDIYESSLSTEVSRTTGSSLIMFLPK